MVDSDDTVSADAIAEWLLTPKPGWEDFSLGAELFRASFLGQDPIGVRVNVRHYRDERGRWCAKCFFGPGAQGAPGYAHGGSIASVLDEVMGLSVWAMGRTVVAAELTTRFKRLVPLGSRCIVETETVSVDGRKIRMKSTLCGEDGALYSEGEALYIEIDPASLGDDARGKLAAMLALRDRARPSE